MPRASVIAARAQLVHDLCARGVIRTARLAEAFGRVPRHLFLPDVDPVDAYEDRAIPVKFEGDVAVSACSQPTMTALMLSELRPRDEERILEIGTGTGYHAALLDELVGRRGSVVSVDIDADLVHRARRALAEAGYSSDIARTADGRDGWPAEAPYDAIVATACVDDIPRAWIEQLRFGGRLLTPMRIRRARKVVLFERRARSIASRAILDGNFMPLRGAQIADDAMERNAAAIAALAQAQPRETPLDLHPDEVEAAAWWLAVHDDDYAGPGPGVFVDGERAEIVVEDSVVKLHSRGPERGAIDRVRRELARWRAANAPDVARVRIEGYVDAREAAESMLARQPDALVIPLPQTSLVIGSD